MTLIETLQKILKQGLTLQITNKTEYCQKGQLKKVIRLKRDELGGKIMIEFAGLRAKTYSYLIDDGSESKKEKSTKKCIVKRKTKFESYKKCLEATQLENKINHL